jgi:hypothetical protein
MDSAANHRDEPLRGVCGEEPEAEIDVGPSRPTSKAVGEALEEMCPNPASLLRRRANAGGGGSESVGVDG